MLFWSWYCMCGSDSHARYTVIGYIDDRARSILIGNWYPLAQNSLPMTLLQNTAANEIHDFSEEDAWRCMKQACGSLLAHSLTHATCKEKNNSKTTCPPNFYASTNPILQLSGNSLWLS